MTQKIIALVDGSIYSESVCHHAAWIAKATGAPVELIHVLGRRDAPEQRDLSGAIRLGARSALMEELADLDAQRAKLMNHRGRAVLEDARPLSTNGVTSINQPPAPMAMWFEAISEMRPKPASSLSATGTKRRISQKGIWGPNL